MKHIGIDVSKATFVAASSSDRCSETRTFDNTAEGIKKFIRTISGILDVHCVMEATGNHSAMLLYLLNSAGITVSMENPLKIKNFARAIPSVVKTYVHDARREKITPAPFKVQSKAIMRFKQKRTVMCQLQKQRTALFNLKGSIECLPILDKGSIHAIIETLACIDKRLTGLRKELTELVGNEFCS